MLTTKRKPAVVWEILVEEFMRPMGLTQSALAEAMGVQRKHVNELCNNRRAVTAATALILARVFGNSPDFWLNVQRRTDLWEAMNSPRDRQRIEMAKPLSHAARRISLYCHLLLSSSTFIFAPIQTQSLPRIMTPRCAVVPA
jgi:addiction module HigA family antidote